MYLINRPGVGSSSRLLSRLIFTYSGDTAYVYGRPRAPDTYGRIMRVTPYGRGYFRDTSQRLRWSLGRTQTMAEGATLSAFVNVASGDNIFNSFILALGALASRGGVTLGVPNTGQRQISLITKNSDGHAFATLSSVLEPETYYFVTVVYASSVEKRIYVNGDLALLSTINRSASNWDTIYINGDRWTSEITSNGGSYSAFGPSVFHGAFNDAQARWLYKQSRDNPDFLFRSRRIFVPTGAAAPSVPILTALPRTNLRRPRYTWTP